jgi:hypothetical protein
MPKEHESYHIPSLTSDRRAAIDAFLKKLHTPTTVAPGTRGRLAFALDATGSRERTWDLACQLHAEMFEEVARLGGLDIQLIYYRGMRECQASHWVSDARTLADIMMRIRCIPGHTQIGRVLAHAKKENDEQKLQALAFIGDCVEEEPADLYAIADELGKRDVRLLMFQEGENPIAGAHNRAMTSGGLPASNGTTSLISLLG